MAEIPQGQGLRAGMDVTAVENDEAAGAVGDAAAVELHDASAAAETRTSLPPPYVQSRYGRELVMAEIPRGQGLRPGMDVTAVEAAGAGAVGDAAAVELHDASAVTKCKASSESSSQAAGSVKMKLKRADAWTEFRGVSRSPHGKYKAQIWDSKAKSTRSVGSFGTAVEAARAYDAAAVEMRGASAVTNFTASGELSGSLKTKVKKPPAVRPDAGTGFHGVFWKPGGKYRAQLWDSMAKSSVPLGTFRTAEEAALPYDAAAVKLYGAAATTNYEQLPTAATTNLEQNPTAAAADDGEVSSTDLPNDLPEPPAVEFSESPIPGPQMDDLGIDWPTAADLQLVYEFLNDFDQVVD